MFYIEKKDDISEDLLDEFKDEGSGKKYVKPKILSSNIKDQKEEKKTVIVKNSGLVSEHDYLFGDKSKEKSKIIDV